MNSIAKGIVRFFVTSFGITQEGIFVPAYIYANYQRISFLGDRMHHKGIAVTTEIECTTYSEVLTIAPQSSGHTENPY